MEETNTNTETAGAAAETASAPAPAAAETANTDAPAAETAQGGETAGTAETAPAAEDTGDLSKVTLGDGKANAGEDGNAAPANAEPPAEINEEDYSTKITMDADIEADMAVDTEAMKAVAPILKEAGVSVETAGKLVNALARYQVEQYKNRNKERFEDNKRMHDAAVKRYSKADFEDINAGIDGAFSRNGVMNYVIRNSEIGNDPEFLELMRWYGKHRPTNTQPMNGGGVGGTTGQSAGFGGIAQSWS